MSARTTSFASRTPTAAPERRVLVDLRAIQGGADFLRLLQSAGRPLDGLIDPDLPPLPPAVRACVDNLYPNAYAAGIPSCFVRLGPGRDDPLFAARLLLRPDMPSVAVTPIVPKGRLAREIAASWLRRSRVVEPDRLWATVSGLARTCAARNGLAQLVLTADRVGAAARVALSSPRWGRVLFVIGGSAEDAGLIRLLRRYGGDVRLTTSCLLGAYGDAAAGLAAAELGRAVPADEIAQWRAGIARPGALLLAEVAAAARALLVPSSWMAGEIATRYGRGSTVEPMAALPWSPGLDGVAAVAAGLHAEACIWAVEWLRFGGLPVRLTLACPAVERPALAALAVRLGVADQIAFGTGAAKVAVVLAMRGGPGLEAVLAGAAAGSCVTSQSLAETVGVPPWVRVVPDQPSPPLLAAAIRDALAAPARST